VPRSVEYLFSIMLLLDNVWAIGVKTSFGGYLA
jgi:hypothetical protein